MQKSQKRLSWRQNLNRNEKHFLKYIITHLRKFEENNPRYWMFLYMENIILENTFCATPNFEFETQQNRNRKHQNEVAAYLLEDIKIQGSSLLTFWNSRNLRELTSIFLSDLKEVSHLLFTLALWVFYGLFMLMFVNMRILFVRSTLQKWISYQGESPSTLRKG